MNDDDNFRNRGDVGNVEIFRNVRTDIKCHTFSEPQAPAELNNDGNFRNGQDFGNIRNVKNFRNTSSS